MKECFAFLFLGYAANKRTKEIHRLDNLTNKCGYHNMANHNKKFGSYLWALYLIKFRGYNGCIHCFKSRDTDQY